jgi:hypothetical protein
LAKAKTDKKKQEAQAVLTDNQGALRELYGRVIAYLKENSLDLVKECGYQAWDEATEKRVQNWIDIVATMNDPKSVSANEVATPVVDVTPAPADADAFMSFGTGSEDDPMPF